MLYPLVALHYARLVSRYQQKLPIPKVFGGSMQRSCLGSAQLGFTLFTVLLFAIQLAEAEPADWEIDSEHFSIALERELLPLMADICRWSH